MQNKFKSIVLVCLAIMCLTLVAASAFAVPYLDNETQYSNQDPLTETRRSDHFRLCFGHYDRDGLNLMNEQYVQGNLQLFEQCWNRWVVEMGMHDINESSNPLYVDGNKYRANFNYLMTWDDGGGGGAFSSADAHGFFYAMANPASCRYDPPSGTTPHEFGHVWEGSAAGFNGTDSSGPWWECMANWMQLQALNTYPQAGGYIYNSVFYPCHGRDYYDSWMIWEAAREDARYGATWVNEIWTNATEQQKVSEYIIDRMIRLDTSGSADKPGAVKDLWGDMAKKMVTWDYERQRWFAQANTPWDGDTWTWYTRCRAPLVKLPGASGTYRPAREHIPQEFGFHYVPLSATAGTTVSCNFQPQCDPVRQSDWRACLVAVSNNGDARYSCLWNTGTNSITLSSDEDELYLMVIAVPKPMKIADPVWAAYTAEYGVQFPYTVAFTNATPTNVIYPAQNHTGMHQHANGLGWVADTATVDATAYVGPNAQVLDTAQVRGYARIEEYGVVKNSAQVRDYAIVSGHAAVYENAQVYGNAKVRDWAMVMGYSELYENAKAIEHAGCGGGDAARHNKVYGSAILKGVTSVYCPSTFSGSLITDGDTANGNLVPGDANYVVADHGVHFGWQWGHNPSIFSGLAENNYQYSGLTFEYANPPFAKDQFGINHGYLMNGCRPAIDAGGTPRGGLVLPLNGTNQYVELHNSLNDFKDMSVAVWVKWAGTATDQRVWSMGDGVNKQMYLTPKNSSTNVVRMSISDGTTTQFVDGAAALGTGWTHIAVTFSGNTGTLYVNGAQVGQNTGMTLDPDALNAALMENSNYLGRGNAGNYLQGSVDEFRVYNKTLSSGEVTTLYNTAAPSPITPVADTTAPTPNAATWLVNPNAISDSAITMSATAGTDASGWVEYYFTCTAGGGHDSGWVSFNKYTDVGLTPGTQYTYTVKMRDKNGNTTTASSALAATAQTSSAGTASFAYGPVGKDSSSITMIATKLSNASGLAEYKFTRNDAVTSGWQSSPSWTNTGLTTNNTYTYTVQVRDGRGNLSAVSAALGATVKDMAAPQLPITVANWVMQPYATIDNKVSMTAMDASDPSGVQYYFHCTAGGLPDSGWQDSATYVTAAVADGSYSFQYKLRDKSAQNNESGYSSIYTAKITPTTGHHSATFAELTTLPDDYLVTFNGLVIQVNPDYYLVKDVASNAIIKVKTDAYGQATDAAMALKICMIKGHLWTYSGVRLVTYAKVTALVDAPTFAVTGRVISASGGAGVPGATVYFSATPNAPVNPTTTATTDAGGYFNKPMVNGQWYASVSAAGFYASSDQSFTVNGAPVADVNFSLVPAFTITASAGTGGSISPTGDSLVSGGANQAYTITANGGYSIGNVTVDGTSVGSVSSYTFSNVSANHTIAATFTANTRSIPQTSNLLKSAVTDSFPDSGNTGSWASYLPSGETFTTLATPVVETINGVKWEQNLNADYDGYDCGTYSSAIACNGASIVVAVKPVRSGSDDNWQSVVDVFYDRLVLGVTKGTGRVCVRRNGTLDFSTATIPDGQITVLSLVVQSTGTYKVFANGTEVMNNTNTSTLTSLVPNVPGPYANHINVGRNNPDGWTTYNGNIGDFFLYKVALSDTDRQTLEADLTSKFGGSSSRTITASAGTGGTISPTGAVIVANGGSATFVVTPSLGYAISQVTVDGANQGAITSYTFSNVTANHTISATFTSVPTYTITASAGSGGSISPTGALVVNSGSSQTYTITPNTGYSVSQVTVDGANQGAITSYTFNNIVANHTISATFTASTNTITASAASGGSISPSGATAVNYGSNQAYTITPDTNYAISSVLVDGVDVGALTSYTFNSVIAPHTISVVFIAGARNIPAADQMIFGIDTKDIPGSGSITTWPWLWPTGTSMTTMGTPTATTVSNVKWEQNRYADGDGFAAGSYSSAIPCTGASIVTVVKPIRNTIANGWNSCVDVFYDRLVLGVKNDSGLVVVRRNGSLDTSASAIPDGQATVLSLVVQSTGTYKVFANGTEVMNNTNTNAMTSLNPLWNGGGTGFWSYINVGRNNPDGWTTFNGDIGDAFLYKTALSDAQRQRLESDVMSKFGISGGSSGTFTITASAGTGGTISPSGAVVVNSGASQTFTITANAGNFIADVQIDGISVGVAGSYTFNNVVADHTISATFISTGFTITSSAGTGGSITPSGAVAVNSGADQTFTITPNTGYAISSVAVDSVNQGSISSYTFNNVTANHTIAAAFVSLGRSVPKSDQLLFSAVTDTFPSSGSTGNWATFWPTGGTFTMMTSPVVDTIGGEKWAQILRADYDGYALGRYSSPIAVNGATIIVAAKPIRNATSDGWNSIVDIFYDRLVLGIRNDTGLVCVKRNINTSNTTNNSSTAIPDGQLTVLSLVVQPDSSYKVFANGTEIMSQAGTGATVSSLNPDHTDTFGSDPDYTHYINLGRNNPDGWSTFNGNIGDVFVYKSALSDTDRQTLEADIQTKFGIQSYNITASAGAGGSISPTGTVAVNAGTSQAFTITPNSGYSISDVTVDSVSQGAISSYTFTNVVANHTISATFVADGWTITASATTGGTITPSGAVSVANGANQSFTIAPSTGYYLSNVTVDSVSLGALSSYTFTNVTANHTIAATFVSTTDLVAYWKFDETSGTTAYDATANAKNATLNGSCAWVAGKTNNAIDIPGGTSYVTVPSGIVNGLTDFSIATWVYMDTRSANMRIFDFGTSTTNYMMLTPQHLTSKGKIRYSISVGGTTQSLTGTALLPTGSWQYVVVTRSGNTGRLYVQGTQVASLTTMTLSPSSLGSTTINRIGDSQTSTHPHLDGRVDGFKIYNRALSAAEITTLYNSGSGLASMSFAAAYNPLIALNASGLEPGILTSWPNAGTLGGEFTNEDTTPMVENVDGKTAVTFDGEDLMKASFLAPASITGNKPFTTLVWAYSPFVDAEGALFSWSTNAQLNFGVPGARAWHLIGASYDGSNVKYYVDGVLRSADKTILAINPDLPVILGAGYSVSGNMYYPTFNFTGSVGMVKVFDRALSKSEIKSVYNAGF